MPYQCRDYRFALEDFFTVPFKMLLLLGFSMLALSACSSMMSRSDRAVVGGIIGGTAGAVVNTSPGTILGGAALGAVIGGVSGD